MAGGNKPLLPPKGEDEVLNALQGEDTERDKMKKPCMVSKGRRSRTVL